LIDCLFQESYVIDLLDEEMLLLLEANDSFNICLSYFYPTFWGPIRTALTLQIIVRRNKKYDANDNNAETNVILMEQ